MDSRKRIPDGIVYNCERLNIREHPSTDSKVLTILDKEATVKVLSKCDDGKFYRVKVNDLLGYAMIDYVKILVPVEETEEPKALVVNESEISNGRNKDRLFGKQ